MSKKLFAALLILLSYSSVALAEYSQAGGTIHVVNVTKGWCGNLAISTKVGKIVDGTCEYEKETQPYGYTGCTQYLNGGLLLMKVGKGYTCAATHVHSNVFGGDAYDEFKLISNSEGQYVGSDPYTGNVELPK